MLSKGAIVRLGAMEIDRKKMLPILLRRAGFYQLCHSLLEARYWPTSAGPCSRYHWKR
jgi:hypothetical protein